MMIRVKLAFLCLALLLALAGCSFRFLPADRNDVPISISAIDATKLDIEGVIKEAEFNILTDLPGASFDGLFLSNTCQNLPNLDGHLGIDFVEVRDERIIVATATIYPEDQEMDIEFWTDPGRPMIVKPVMTNERFQRAMDPITNHLDMHGITDCPIKIAQVGNVWRVRCGPPGVLDPLCSFEIDLETGKIEIWP